MFSGAIHREAPSQTATEGAVTMSEAPTTMADTPTGNPLAEVSYIGESPFRNLANWLNTYAYNPDDLTGKTPQFSYPGKDDYLSPVSTPNAIYRAMQTDDTVYDALRELIVARLASGYNVTPGGNKARDKKQAEFVDWNLRNIPVGSFYQQTKELGSAVKYGFAVSEMIFENALTGKWKGHTILRQLKCRTPDNFQFAVNEYGDIRPDGLVQTVYIEGKPMQRRLNWKGKFVILVHDFEFSNWFGRSALRAAYSAWWSKSFFEKCWGIYLDRFGTPVVVATLGKVTANDATTVANVKKIVTNLQTATGITVPEDVTFSFLEATRSGRAGFDKAIEHMNERIRNAILGKSHEQTQLAVHDLGKEIESSLNDQLVKRLVDLNWDATQISSYPVFTFAPVRDEKALERAKVLVDGVGSGAVTADIGSENTIRQSVGAPPIDEETWRVSRTEQRPDQQPDVPDDKNKDEDEDDKGKIVPGQGRVYRTTDDHSLSDSEWELILAARHQVRDMLTKKGIVERGANAELAALVKRLSLREFSKELVRSEYETARDALRGN